MNVDVVSHARTYKSDTLPSKPQRQLILKANLTIAYSLASYSHAVMVETLLVASTAMFRVSSRQLSEA